jgi:hypothetical protein
MPRFNQDGYAMRTEQELRQKIKELEASHQHWGWDIEFLERESKVIARAKIWGILYALGYAEEEMIPLHSGDFINPSVYEIISDDPE